MFVPKLPEKAAVLRQENLTLRDLPARMASVLLVIALSGFYLSSTIVLSTLVLYVVIELWGFWAVRVIQRRISWWSYINLLAGACIGSIVFLRIPVEMWQLDGFTAKLFALCTLITCLIHCATVRVYHLPLATVTGLPVVIAIGQTVVRSLLESADVIDMLVGLAIIMLMVCYITMMMIDGAKARRVLIEARDAADAANAAKSRFLTAMSHEIRTPLNGILGIAHLLKEDAKTQSERERSGVLVNSAKALKTIVDDVLDHAKIEAGKLTVRPVDASLEEMAQEVVGLFSVNAQEKGLWLRLHTSRDLPQLLNFDPLRVRQILSNLVSNAIKFTDKGGVDIHLSVEPQGASECCVSVSVVDTGIGIPSHAQAQLFEQFRQFDDKDDRAASGTGLGLSISLGLAQLMDGKIELTSDAHRGAEFTLVFAARRVDPQPSGNSITHLAKAQGTGSKLGGHVLLVDDNASNRFVVRAFLKDSNVDISEAEDGVVAVRKAQSTRYDLILLDMHMPKMDGKRAFAEIRKAGASRNTPVVALTADSAPEDRDTYLNLGMEGYLSKPVAKTQLLTELSRFLACPEPAQTAAE